MLCLACIAVIFAIITMLRYTGTATKSDQAKIVLKEVIKFIDADADLSELFETKEYNGEVKCNLTQGVIKALGRDTKSIDGFRPYLGIVDEYHAHKDNQMYKLFKGGTRNMKESLASVITTAGFNLNGPCYELYKYCNLPEKYKSCQMIIKQMNGRKILHNGVKSQ